MLCNRVGDQAENTDRRVEHHDARHANHHVADDRKEVEHGLAAFTEPGKRKAEDHGKEDDLQHAALREGFHRVDRHDVEKRVDELGRSDGLHLQAFGREVETDARLNEVCKEQTNCNGNGRRDGIDEQHLDGDAPELGRVGNAGSTSNDRGDDERHDHHADQADEELTERLQVALRERRVNHGADDDTEHKADHHLPSEAETLFIGGHSFLHLSD